MRIYSSAFSDGDMIPRRFTCAGGDDASPPLAWTDAPAATRSFVLICDDPDTPMGTWHHWAACDIPPDQTSLAEGVGARADTHDFKQAVNDFRSIGYKGPCPPHGHRPHHYRFRRLALAVDRLTVRTDATCEEIEHKGQHHVLSEATLVGLYQR